MLPPLSFSLLHLPPLQPLAALVLLPLLFLLRLILGQLPAGPRGREVENDKPSNTTRVSGTGAGMVGYKGQAQHSTASIVTAMQENC